MSTTNTLGNVFKDARIKKGLTQAELGEKAGLGYNTYPKIERGVSKPGWESIKSICKVLGIDPKKIMDLL